ncbi:MAG: DUF4271 domain-containing protein [Bacteroidota bacterium]|nr:DUF4271 domain-containing protein [Bacteroidota bacterium]
MSPIFDSALKKTLRTLLVVCGLSVSCSAVWAQKLDSSRSMIPQKMVKLSVQKKKATLIRSDSASLVQVAASRKTDTAGRDTLHHLPAPPLVKSPRRLPEGPAALRDTNEVSINLPMVAVPPVHSRSYYRVVDSLLRSGRWLHSEATPEYFITTRRVHSGKEFAFYSICLMVLFLGLLRTFYPEYFNKLFRVFFNTSIRQNQLTDQLGQATFPSFILNLFFALSAGFYTWLLIRNYQNPKLINTNLLLPFCIAAVGAIYLVKFFIIKAVGWMTGTQKATDQYIFVIFLVNKIAGIALVPFIILMEFANHSWVHPLEIFSLLLLGLFFITRYLKTYSALENRFPLNPLHFVLYILSIEIIPLLVIYKMAVDYFI